MIETLTTLEYGLSPAALLLLIAYHLHLYYKTRNDPLSTAQGLARRTRSLWVKAIIRGGKDILAVQTLRNWTMAATFLASTAILIGLGIFNLAVTADKQGEMSLLMSHFSSNHPALWMTKLILLGSDFLFVFFNFTLAVRYYNLTGFMINISADAEKVINMSDVTDILDRGSTHYTLGMRGYYLSIPLALWLFGPLWLVAGSIVLIIILYRLDRGI